MAPAAASVAAQLPSATKKAVLAALRGLVVGTTSCAVALMVEDRRRRINQALRVIESGERIRACPSYRPGAGDALVAAAVEAAVTVDYCYPLPPDASGAGAIQWTFPHAPRRGEWVEVHRRAEDGITAGGGGGGSGGEIDGMRKSGAVGRPSCGRCEPSSRAQVEEGGVERSEKTERKRRKIGEDERPAEVVVSPNNPKTVSNWRRPQINRQGDVLSSSRQVRRRVSTTTAAMPAPFLETMSSILGLAPSVDNTIPNCAEEPPPPKQYDRRGLGSTSFPSNDEIIKMVGDACKERGTQDLTSAKRLFHDAVKFGVAPSNLDTAWMGASAQLCCAMQALGDLDEAAEFLGRMIERGPMDEASYLAHRPMELIKTLFSRFKDVTPPLPSAESPDPAIRAAERQTRFALSQANLKLFRFLTFLFLPVFPSKPSPNAAVHETGKELLTMAMWLHQNPALKLDQKNAPSLDQMGRVERLYWRCVSAREDPDCELTAWLITSLQEHSEHKAAIKFFLTCFVRMSPDGATLYSVAGAAIRAVQKTNGAKAAQVLKALIKLFGGEWRLPPDWVVSGLEAHWRRHLDFPATEALYRDLLAANLRDVLAREEDLHRIMIKVSLEADMTKRADSYFSVLVSTMPQFAGDAKTLGTFALFYAKRADWDGVRRMFEKMVVGSEKDEEARSKAFVPVIQLYVESHTAGETEDFMRFYFERLRVRIHRYLVPLMANVYGVSHDASAFIRWLDYCSRVPNIYQNRKSGFSNAILVNCRRRWCFSFNDLRTVYRKLQALDPGFVDSFSEQLMAKAALDDAGHDRGAARSRLLSLHIHEPDRLIVPALGEVAPETALALSMNMAIEVRKPARALREYRAALDRRLIFTPTRQLLQLALWARGMLDQRKITSGTFELLHDAEVRMSKGLPGGRGAWPGQLRRQQLLEGWIGRLRVGLQLESLDHNLTGIAVETAVDGLLQAWTAQQGLACGDLLLNRAADACLRAGRYEAAVRYALKAAEVAESAYWRLREREAPVAAAAPDLQKEQDSEAPPYPTARNDRTSDGTAADDINNSSVDADVEQWEFEAAAQVAQNGPGPCYSLRNFLVLVSAYTGLGQARLVRLAASRAESSVYVGEAACRSVLRLGLRRVRRAWWPPTAMSAGRGVAAGDPEALPCWPARVWRTAPEVRGMPGTTTAAVPPLQWRETRAVIRQGLEMLARARERAREEGVRQSEEAIEIMRRLAREAGRPEVDFEDIPWLGGDGVWGGEKGQGKMEGERSGLDQTGGSDDGGLAEGEGDDDEETTPRHYDGDEGDEAVFQGLAHELGMEGLVQE